MIVLDTSFLVALFNSQDVHHQKAKKLQSEAKDSILLLAEYVLLELTTVLASRTSLKISESATNSLLNASEVNFIPCSEVFSSTLKKFHSQKKFKLSFVDCALIEIKNKYGADKIYTFDANIVNTIKKKRNL